MVQKQSSHLDNEGNIKMVDVGAKATTQRIAKATAHLSASPETVEAIWSDTLPKGDALTTAKIAGIQAAKQTAQLIPMCHHLLLDMVDITFEKSSTGIALQSEVRLSGKTGAEMEALRPSLSPLSRFTTWLNRYRKTWYSTKPMFLLNQGEKVDATKKSKFVRKAWFCTLCLGFFIGCSAHRSDTTEAQYQNHWYTSIDGHFSVQTPKSLEYRQDTLTIHTENKSFTMNLGVHHGNICPLVY